MRTHGMVQAAFFYLMIDRKDQIWNREVVGVVRNSTAACHCAGAASSDPDIACCDTCKMQVKKLASDMRVTLFIQIGPITFEAPDMHFSMTEDDPSSLHFGRETSETEVCNTPEPSKCIV
jgi:hypothetical protein